MAPSPDELWKDVYEEAEDISYSWVREYQWDVRGDDAEDHATYIVALGEKTARYLPLPTKLVLRKKRAKDGRSNTEVEHYPVPASVTVRNRPEVSAKELKDSRYTALKPLGDRVLVKIKTAETKIAGRILLPSTSHTKP